MAQTQKPFIVVLTGGPSAGKSSAMAILRDRLSVRGFQVLTIPENATHFLANSDGFQPEWAGAPEQVRMQRIFMDYQIAQEEAFKAFAALHPRKRAVLLLDCCSMNSKVYLSEEQFQQLMNLEGFPPLQEADLMARYDLVIHMKTVAYSKNGGYEWGPGSNNPGRYHTPEQAKEFDERCLAVFSAHPQLRVVPHCGSFTDKIDKVLDFVNDGLHVDGLAGKRRRVPVSVQAAPFLDELVSQSSTSSFTVTTTFLDDQMQHSARRRVKVPAQSWLERYKRLQSDSTPDHPTLAVARPGLPLLPADVAYERRSTVTSREEEPMTIMTRRVVHEEDYYAAIESAHAEEKVGASAEDAAGACRGVTATKHVLSFVVGSNYYELFFFASKPERLILDLGEQAPTPEGLEPLSSSTEPVAARTPQRQSAAREEAAAATATTERPAKRVRTLGRHTTEEAALRLPAKLLGSAGAASPAVAPRQSPPAVLPSLGA
eukprot:TRINITY_DN8356_c0_g1_i1.p1 TRINITY_DN8356_c0_g1~~TRINITY_DN8356_c0_g1_i1.p1  ORF type:complete len:502 (-),score=124.41 TRINITY_DN8356_c0_g1_i1:96-1556(-)